MGSPPNYSISGEQGKKESKAHASRNADPCKCDAEKVARRLLEDC